MHKIFRYIYIYIYIYQYQRGRDYPTCEIKKKKIEKEEGFHVSVRYLENETRSLSSEHRHLEIIS
jgi:hypothetical protein